jgi:5-methylcytosine-specific restriction endonuclease McrA
MNNSYLNDLHDKSVWAFTKQTTDFEVAFKATHLFANYCENEDPATENLEDYFTRNAVRYEIGTNRHRMLVISQLFGLITKTPFYSRGSQYNKERPTEIFEMIRDCQVGDSFYNIVKTEQLLKLKIHAIIDTTNNNKGYNILPILFIYKVLKKLKDRYKIKSISIDHLYTYVMTCKSYDEVDNAVEFIRKNAPTDVELVSAFKDFSRVLTVIKNNISLFVVEQNDISINPVFDEYFYNNFVERFDFDALHERLLRDVDYSYFLYNYQGFEINLIDEPQHTKLTHKSKSIDIQLTEDGGDKEKDYQDKVDRVKEGNVNEAVADDAHKFAPAIAIKKQVAMQYERNPLLGKLAIKKADYTCEYDRRHETFISQSTQKPYMEAHHLIPITFQKDMWDKYQINIDCVENLVSLCPTCHKAFHYGTLKVKRDYLKYLFEQVEHKYKAIDFNITLAEIERCYGL